MKECGQTAHAPPRDKADAHDHADEDEAVATSQSTNTAMEVGGPTFIALQNTGVTMSETARNLFDSLKEAAQARIAAIGPELSAEAGRLGRQGANELASALFTGNTFVLYGSGQKASEPEHETSKSVEIDPTRGGQERGGRE